MYLLTAIGITDRLPPDAHPPLLPDLQAGRVRLRRRSARWRSRARSTAGSPTTASTTPTPTRRATRTARTSGTATASPASSAASGTRTSAGCSRSRAARDWKKYAPDLDEDPGMRFISRHFVWFVALSLAAAGARAASLLTGTLARRRYRACSGAGSSGSSSCTTSPGRSTPLPLHGNAAIRHRRRVDERLLARPALAGRGVAPQPPRVPALGRPRPSPVGARSIRHRSSR